MDSNWTMSGNATSLNSSNGTFSESAEQERYYSPLFGMELSMPEWEALVTILALGLVIIITIVGKNKRIVSINTYMACNFNALHS